MEFSDHTDTNSNSIQTHNQATFIPLYVSVDRMLGSEADFWQEIAMGDFLAVRWVRPYSVVMGWVRARLY